MDVLKQLRNRTGLSKALFAAKMGVPLRTYENLESGRSPVREVHLNAARWAVLQVTGTQVAI